MRAEAVSKTRVIRLGFGGEESSARTLVTMSDFTVPGLDPVAADKLSTILQHRLAGLIDLHLTLKHVHWNVVGPNFIAVHEMLDPQVDLVRGFSDDIAERIAALGASPVGTLGAQERERSWDDYSLGRDTAQRHLAALNKVYGGVIADHRSAIAETGDFDPVTEDMLTGQSAELEKFQWFVRAHLEGADGQLAGADKTSEIGAAQEVEDA